jgi:anti-sigma regulatory factor (Ser/Thr protein kinase)
VRPGRKGIEEIVNKLLREHDEVRAGTVAELAGVSRQAAHRHLASFVEGGLLKREGKGRAARYVRTSRQPYQKKYLLKGLSEEAVWDEFRMKAPSLKELTNPILRILSYIVTELVNNAIDHSSGTWVQVGLSQPQDFLEVEVEDDGVGIFRHLQKELKLADLESAIQELSKGKVTTDPQRHTGEGLFFISKIADVFSAQSNTVIWKVDNRRSDMAMGQVPERTGTQIRCELSPHKTQTLQHLFNEYAKDFHFTKTRIVVKLFEMGKLFVSRSEAKRILGSLEKFTEVILDFKGIDEIGQGFADEMFRVWAGQHPETSLFPTNMNAAVTFMVKRAGAKT